MLSLHQKILKKKYHGFNKILIRENNFICDNNKESFLSTKSAY